MREAHKYLPIQRAAQGLSYPGFSLQLAPSLLSYLQYLLSMHALLCSVRLLSLAVIVWNVIVQALPSPTFEFPQSNRDGRIEPHGGFPRRIRENLEEGYRSRLRMLLRIDSGRSNTGQIHNICISRPHCTRVPPQSPTDNARRHPKSQTRVNIG